MAAVLWLYAGLFVGYVCGLCAGRARTGEPAERPRLDITRIHLNGSVSYVTHRQDSGELIRR